MPRFPDTVQGLDLDAEVRDRAEYLSATIPELEQQQTYKLLQPVIESNRSLSPPSRGLRTSLTPPLFSTSQTAFTVPDNMIRQPAMQLYTDAMPSLTSFDDELENIDIKFDDSIKFNLPNSPQRDGSPMNESRTPDCTSPTEAQTSIEETHDFVESVEDEEDINAEFEKILWDAKDNFRGKKPEFITTSAGIESSRRVDLGDNQTGDMTLEAWDDSKNQSYWVLQDNHGYKCIVKYFSQGKGYRVWRGANEGFDVEPIAWPEKSQSSRRSSTVAEEDDIQAEQSAGDDVQVLDKDQEESGRGLRKRRWSQKYPYTADKKIRAAAQKGKVKRVSDIDAEESNRSSKPVKTAKKSSPRATQKASRPRRAGSAATTRSDPVALDPEGFRAYVMAKTTLRTHLPGNKVAIPLFLSGCRGVETLWDKVSNAWKDEYEGKLKCLEIQFSWLGTECHIKLKASLPDSYEKMIQEIQDAPCWKDGADKCTVDVVLVVA